MTYLHVRASLVAQTVKNLPAMQETQVQSLDWEDSLVAQTVKNLPAMQETQSVPGLGRSPGEGNDSPSTPVFLPGEFHGQRSLVAIVHGITKDQT